MSIRVVEMRQSPRIDVNTPAKIVVMSSGLHIKEILDCKILNVSEGGALIAANSPITAPEFYLETDNDRGALRLCSVVWRASKYKVGVQFLRDRA